MFDRDDPENLKDYAASFRLGVMTHSYLFPHVLILCFQIYFPGNAWLCSLVRGWGLGFVLLVTGGSAKRCNTQNCRVSLSSLSISQIFWEL